MSTTPKPVLGMILKGYPRISEAFISNEILLLEKLGFSIRIFSMRHPRESFTHESVNRIRAKADYLPHELRRFFHRLAYHNFLLALRIPRAYGRAMRMAFARFLRSRKSATLKHLLQAGYLVHRFLPGRGVVHLHAHFAHSPSSVALFASVLSGLPFSFTAHAKDIYTANPEQLREKIGRARFVVTCTDYNRDYLEDLAVSESTPIYRVYHGIDMDLFTANPGKSLPTEPYRILTVARLVPKKGLPTVYRALRELKDRGMRFRHDLVGDGDDRDSILDLIRKQGLEKDCRWLGTLPHEKVLERYRQADLFVLGCEIAPNGDRDGIPNVLIEAMAMGVPAVATRVSALPELIRDGETGLLVPPRQANALADAMARLLTDADLRERMIPAAREFVQREFDNSRLIQDLAGIYRREQPLLR